MLISPLKRKTTLKNSRIKFGERKGEVRCTPEYVTFSVFVVVDYLLVVLLGLPPAPVQLLYPISRFRTMQTLQHSCRFEILKHVRKDHISDLPVPQRVKDYLEESQYYVETLCDV